MKIAPILRALRDKGEYITPILVHTGQHYDEAMNDTFFEQLEIPKPNIHLEVGSGSHAIQTAEVMKKFEQVVLNEKPDAILVVGDVNSTIACALVAAKLGIRVIHVEAGLRSYDRSMPEEINRILTDQLSELLFTTELEAEVNLAKEGIESEKVRFVGNVMIDTLFHNLVKAKSSRDIIENNNLSDAVKGKYGVVTLHRPSNVDDHHILKNLLATLREIANEIPLIFPVHPRTSQKIIDANLDYLFEDSNIFRTGPLAYLDLLGLMRDAEIVLTDSGGIQEETTALGVPCITLRENTERPITITKGTNTLVGTDSKRILVASRDILSNGGKVGKIPELWDGHAAERIVDELRQWL